MHGMTLGSYLLQVYFLLGLFLVWLAHALVGLVPHWACSAL